MLVARGNTGKCPFELALRRDQGIGRLLRRLQVELFTKHFVRHGATFCRAGQESALEYTPNRQLIVGLTVGLHILQDLVQHLTGPGHLKRIYLVIRRRS